jgi:hypothetical protein
MHGHMNAIFRILFVFSVLSLFELYLCHYFIFYKILLSYDWSFVYKKSNMDPVFSNYLMLIEALLNMTGLFSNSLICILN